MKYNIKLLLAGVIALAVSLQACKQKAQNKSNARFDNNTSEILVDESFSPIVDEEMFVFKYSYPKANPHIFYGPENTVVNMLLADSARVLMLARDLTATERNYLETTNNLRP